MSQIAGSASKKRKKTVADKRVVRDSGPNLEANYFINDDLYQRYLTLKEKPVSPVKCWELNFLESRPLAALHELLSEYKLVKFVTFSASCYPRLVKMFYTNVGVMDGQAANYVMNKKVVINVELLVNLFEMDGEAPFKQSKDLQDYTRDEAIKLLFPNSEPHVVTGKILTTGLSVEDRLLHYTIVKCILPRATNTTNIVEDELFLLWAFKKKIPLNIPFLIIQYMGQIASRVPSFLPYGMILSAIFKATKVPVALEKEVANPDSSTWINETTFHNMQLRLVRGTWVRADGSGGRRRTEVGGSSSGEAPAAIPEELLELLRNNNIKLSEMQLQLVNMQNSLLQSNRDTQDQITALETKMDEGNTELHSRLNTLKAQLNEIQSQVTPEE